MKYFKQDFLLIDVEAGNIFNVNTGKVMKFDFDNMTMKCFSTTSKRIPIRFNDEKELMFWDQSNSWCLFKRKYIIEVQDAVVKLIELKIEKELLG